MVSNQAVFAAGFLARVDEFALGDSATAFDRTL